MVLFWVVLGSVGAVPFIISDVPNMSVSEAFFESFSGLTTTGATVLTGLDNLPKAFLFYRQLLQWLGGMGIIVLAVAVLPLLGIGGMQLYRAEIPGPVKDNKVTPRIAETAKALWFIYLLLTSLCALAYWMAGMTLFDAICHSFSTLSVGVLDPRRQHRFLRQPGHQPDHSGVPVAGERQLRASLHGVCPQAGAREQLSA